MLLALAMWNPLTNTPQRLLRSGFIYALALVTCGGCSDPKPKASEKVLLLYGTHCARCHEVGAANSPKKGDVAAWAKRLRKGENVLIESAKKGLVAMPPKGDCTSCTDDDLRDLIQYMSQ